jgi:c(7)-type cytochrome triheme protein
LTALGSACRSAAAVILDLPPPKSNAEAVAPLPAGRAPQAIQDTARPAIEETLDPDSVIALLPQDSGGNVDWVAAIRLGVLQPRWNLPGEDNEPQALRFGFDFFLKGPNPMFDALFPHSAHTAWLDCRGCHPAVYKYRGDSTNMAAINRGESCGQCHGRVAFSSAACFRCHPAMPPSGKAEPVLLGDVVFTRDSITAEANAAFPPGRFPHWPHRIRYACTVCHPAVFEMRAGANQLSMAAMQAGGSCGACHDGRNAFSLMECNRCHVPPLPGEDPER